MKIISALLILALLLPACVSVGEGSPEDYTVSFDGIQTGGLNAGTSVHDPSVIEDSGTYYIFGSHMVGGKSSDLRTWQQIGNGYSKSNTVWGNLWAEGSHVFDYTGEASSLIPTDDRKPHVWAPDVIYNPVMGKYMLYYCTSSTWNASSICFGVSDSITGPYEWQRTLVCSGFNLKTVSGTNVMETVDEEWIKKNYLTPVGDWNYNKWPNAIDPCIFFDQENRFWMVYGSWSGGIFLLELDPASGLVIHPAADKEKKVDPYFGKYLMGGRHQAMEAPYIQYDPESGYYYLFVSYGELVREGGYQIRVFRSKSPDGDYEDMNGKRPGTSVHYMFGLKLSGNYMLPSLKQAYMATGHNSAFIDKDGKKYVVCHTRFDSGSEYHLPLVRQYGINEEGWPCLLPYATRKEDLKKGFTTEDIAGRYYVINQGTAISADIAQPFILYLREDGTVGAQDQEGTWTLGEEGYYVHLTLGDKTWSGLAADMTDEADTPVRVFTLVGQNESVWGVKYIE